MSQQGKMILPASLNPISRRKDKSVKLSFETRELNPEETMILMAMEGAEMWLCMAMNEDEIPDVPEERAEVDEKTPSERLRGVLFVWYKQLTDSQKYVGTFENFKNEKMETIIEGVKKKLV
jgi:hypothetical protein